MSEDVFPIELSRNEDGTSLLMIWSDGMRRSLKVEVLRRACPCATCREKRLTRPGPAASTSLPIVKAVSSAMQIVAMQPAGNYGYHIEFSDGHASGIYTLEMLREFCPE